MKVAPAANIQQDKKFYDLPRTSVMSYVRVSAAGCPKLAPSITSLGIVREAEKSMVRSRKKLPGWLSLSTTFTLRNARRLKIMYRMNKTCAAYRAVCPGGRA